MLESIVWPMSDAAPDRFVARVLSLPIFDRSFANAIRRSPFGSVAFVSAMEARSGSEFTDKIWALAGSLDSDTLEAFQGRETMLEQFWSLTCSVERAYLESTSVQLGFGLCEYSSKPVQLDESASLRKQSAIAALLKPTVRPPKKVKVDSTASTSSTPLLDKERNLKWKWASRLEQIGLRAGSFARLFQESAETSDLSEGERLQLKQMVLITGAHRTMAAHIQSFERFEKWCAATHVSLYPLTIDRILKYCLFLDGTECGPSVLPNFRAEVKWVCARLAIEPPDFSDHRFVAIQNKVISERAKTLKEAIPFPLSVVMELETFVIDTNRAPASRVFVWWILCMVFASLRFDDAIHVRPGELQMKEEGLFGVAWQTKVDQKRMGTRFVVPKIGFRESTWLEVGWTVFTSQFWDNRDFWIWDLNTPDAFKPDPPSYQRSLQWMKVFSRRSCDESDLLSRDEKIRCAREINKPTMHSCRVTLLDAAVHAGRSTEEIGLQANWKNPGPLVLKYTRNRSVVPALMVKQLVRDLVQSEHPVVESEHEILVDACDMELDSIEFFIKTPSPGSYYEYKFHCTSRSDESVTACNKFNLVDCSSVGDTLPDVSVFCKACARARPEVASFFDAHASSGA